MQDWVASLIWLHRRTGELNQARPVLALCKFTSLADLLSHASRSATKTGFEVSTRAGG